MLHVIIILREISEHCGDGDRINLLMHCIYSNQYRNFKQTKKLNHYFHTTLISVFVALLIIFTACYIMSRDTIMNKML